MPIIDIIDKKIVIASDSFKGSLSSAEVAEAVAMGIKDVYSDRCNIVKVEIADGGEGTLRALIPSSKARLVNKLVKDPLGRYVNATYGIMQDGTAIIETAEASGLTLLKDSEKNPLITSTYGTGELILDAACKGCRKFIIGLGGSGTNDGGTGMLEALGVRFIGGDGKIITGCCGETLHRITDLDSSGIPKEIQESTFIVACDVETKFCGPEGATYTFAAQKGADIVQSDYLEKGMNSFNKCILRKTGIDLNQIPGSGAAGGLGGAFHAFLKAELKKGADIILEAIQFENIIKDADLIITGEGKIDNQTRKGKAPYTVLSKGAAIGIPVIAIAGIVEISEKTAEELGFDAVLPIQPKILDSTGLNEAMDSENTIRNIRTTVRNYLNSTRK